MRKTAGKNVRRTPNAIAGLRAIAGLPVIAAAEDRPAEPGYAMTKARPQVALSLSVQQGSRLRTESCQRDDFFVHRRQLFEPAGRHGEAVLDADRSYAGNDELRLECENHALRKDFLRPGSQHGHLVDFDADAVSDEACLLAVPHEVFR